MSLPVVPGPLDRLRRLALELPEATEKLAWGEPTFRVRDKLFAMYADGGNHHGGGHDAVWCNAPLGVQEMLLRSDSDRYFVPPYVGVKGWIGIRLAEVEDGILREHLADSYAMVAPKRLLPALDEMRECRSHQQEGE